MNRSIVLAASAALFLTACGEPGLESLVLEGFEMHPSLSTLEISEVERLHVPREILTSNPIVSSDTAFVTRIARAGSQGRLTSAGIRSALYALYQGENELGFYGLEAETLEDAVTKMARYQLGRQMSARERGRIVAFLESLTGELDGVPLGEHQKTRGDATAATGAEEGQ